MLILVEAELRVDSSIWLCDSNGARLLQLVRQESQTSNPHPETFAGTPQSKNNNEAAPLSTPVEPLVYASPTISRTPAPGYQRAAPRSSMCQQISDPLLPTLDLLVSAMSGAITNIGRIQHSTSLVTACVQSDASKSSNVNITLPAKGVVNAASGENTSSVQPDPQQPYEISGDEANTGSTYQSPSTKGRGPCSSNSQPLRTPHSIVEHRYRYTTKVQLDTLITKLPALKNICADTSAIENPNCLTKSPSKALVIASAVEHIEKLGSDSAKTNEFVEAL
jgi:hypothetical protein